MDPQLLAARQAARDRFAAHQAREAERTAAGQVGSGPPAAGTAVSEAAVAASAAAAAAPATLPAARRPAEPSAVLAAARKGSINDLPPELLNLPISALLEDGPSEAAPPPKRRCLEPGQLRVPPERTEEIRRALQEPAPEELRLLTWNIDGLDEVGGPEALMLRTLAAALEVARRRPFAVLLQEVVPPALQLLAAEKVLGGSYEVVVPNDPPMPYYVAILLDKRRARRLGPPATVPFPGTRMGRQLLCVTLQLAGGGPPLLLATAHLESTKDHAAERRRQMLQSLRHLRAQVGKAPAGAPPGTAPVGAAVLGGDLNAREDDVREVMQQLGAHGGVVADAWTFCGSPANARYTWDTVENDNVGASYSCKTRFDRVLFLSPGVSDKAPAPKAKAKAKAKAAAAAALATEAAAAAEGWRPTSVSLVGKARVPGLGRFPSDHWGVLTAWAAGGPASAAPAVATASAAPAARRAPAESAAPAACALPLAAPGPVAEQLREFATLTTKDKCLVIDLDED